MRSFLRLWHRWWLAWSSCEWIWGNKKAEASGVLLLSVLLSAMFYLPWCSLETVSDLRPFLRRALSTRRPLAVCIRRRNPCLLILFLLWGWNVLFIFVYFVYLYFILLFLFWWLGWLGFVVCLVVPCSLVVSLQAPIVSIGHLGFFTVCFDYGTHVSCA